LTYLSIIHTVKTLQARGGLVSYEPTIARDVNSPGRRFLWLTPDACKWCCPASAHSDNRIRDASLAHLQDQLNAFVRGDFMEYEVDIRRLSPDESDVWEIRSHLKKPQLRLIGWFVLPKMFVAVDGVVRDDLEKTHGPKWERVIANAAKIRSRLMGPVNWYDEDPHNYL
jgi:hypothetical protein